MQVTFIDTTNTAFKELKGAKGKLSLDFNFSFNFSEDTDFQPSFDFRHGYMTSSPIESYTCTEITRNYFEIVINTKNTTYTFTKGEKSDKEPLTKEQILAMQLSLGMDLI